MSRRPRIGEVLIQAGIIDELQLEAALGQQQRWGGRLGRSLVGLGFLDEPTLVRVLSDMLRVPVAQLGHKHPAPDVLELLSADLAEKYCCIPLFTKREGGKAVLYLGMEDPSDLAALDELAFRLGMPVRPVLVAPTELRDAIGRLYHHSGGGSDEAGDTFRETILEPGDTAPVISPIFGESDTYQPDPGPLPAPDAAAPPPAPTALAAADATPAPERPASPGAPVPQPGLAPDPPPAALPAAGVPVEVRVAPTAAPAADAAAAESGLAAASAAPKPRDVPTRTILRALTRILIEKGVLTREELMRCVRALDAAASRDGDPQA